MNTQTRFSVLSLLVIVALLATACAAAPTPAPQASPLPPAAGRGVQPEVLPGSPATSDSSKTTTGASTAVGDRLIIKTGKLTMVVKDVQESIGVVTNVATEAGGFVISSQSGREEEKLVATVTIKVPVTSFEPIMEKLRKLAVEPPTESVTGQDVTEEYGDLDAQLRNLQATEKQLLNLLDKAQTVEDTLRVYEQLTNIRGQIERIQGRMNYLQKNASMSTITVGLRPVPDKPIVQTGKNAWDPGETFKDALRTLVSFAQILAGLAIWLVVFSPIFLVPILVLWLIWKWTRRRSKKTS